MTFEEYNEQFDVLRDKLEAAQSDEEWDAAMKNINDFQYKHMGEFVAEYQNKVNDDPARQVIYEAFDYVVHKGTNGTVNMYVDSEELANKIEEISWDDLGQFMLEPPEVYKEKERYGGQWCISFNFGGVYIPEWDGWKD